MTPTPIGGIASGFTIGLGIYALYLNSASSPGWGLIGAGVLILWLVTKPWHMPGKKKKEK